MLGHPVWQPDLDEKARGEAPGAAHGHGDRNGSRARLRHAKQALNLLSSLSVAFMHTLRQPPAAEDLLSRDRRHAQERPRAATEASRSWKHAVCMCDCRSSRQVGPRVGETCIHVGVQYLFGIVRSNCDICYDANRKGSKGIKDLNPTRLVLHLDPKKPNVAALLCTVAAGELWSARQHQPLEGLLWRALTCLAHRSTLRRTTWCR